jgi:uncharacterized spore protein YtfJ
MSSTEPMQPIAELIARSVSIRHIYGEPVRQGDTTVIPIAKVAYWFGGGGGGGHAKNREATEDGTGNRPAAFGSGGGGAVQMTPAGVLEIGPGGPRFIRFRPWAPLIAALAAGLAAGWLLGQLGRRG